MCHCEKNSQDPKIYTRRTYYYTSEDFHQKSNDDDAFIEIFTGGKREKLTKEIGKQKENKEVRDKA